MGFRNKLVLIINLNRKMFFRSGFKKSFNHFNRFERRMAPSQYRMLSSAFFRDTSLMIKTNAELMVAINARMEMMNAVNSLLDKDEEDLASITDEDLDDTL
jgi:hypothetical protein